MKHIILSLVVILSCLTGFAQGGYDPENPGDPNPYRKLTVHTAPKAGGRVDVNKGSQVGVGQTVYCYANENPYYDFVHWLQNGEIVSTAKNFSFTMPDEDVVMMAVFELNYNPQSPDDPQESKPSHRVTVTATPGKGGHFNSSVFKLCEGDSINIYAYPNEGYRFEEWLLDGVLLSSKNPLNIKMTDKDLHYTARFSYDPINPVDPAVNLFNPGTGEMVIDRFEQGYLSNAISRLLNDDYDYSDIQSLLVCGMMAGSDFGGMSRLSNCSIIDLSRTNGYTEVPSYAFEATTSLTELLLPSCINTIARYAFSECTNLSVITCYAVIPPGVEYGVFDGVDESMVVKVPAQSVDLYKNADGWKNFTILSANDNVFSISVSLPSDAKDGRYKNMSIELLNTSNGQRYKYLITDKTEYVFGNLLSHTKYSVFVKNSKDEILGEITDLEVVDKDLSASFQSLRQPLNISLQIFTPDGENITDDVIVKWFNESNELLHQGSLLTGVLENSVVSYTISLPQQLQTVYSQPISKTLTVSESNSLICTLAALEKSILKGRIIDNENQPISAAIITVSQNINGTYTNSENVLCDNGGNFNLEIPDVPVKITVSANGYIAQTKELQSASAGLGEIVLEKNFGITIFPSYTFQESSSAGEAVPETNWYSNDANIAYSISDINGNEIPNCIYQAGSILLPETIELEDNVIVTAFSKDNKFKDVSQSLYLTSKSVYVKLPIVEYGGISVKTTDTETKLNTCILYDATERQVGKASLRNNGISFTHLPDGEYSLITMNKSSLLGSIQNLSSLRETSLEEGKDFLINKVDVISGRISDVTIADVPDLNETKLYYTNSNETYFMPNKSQLTIGNYVTLKAKITIKNEYAGDIDAATLIVDIPSNCEFVENSIISGSGYLGYEYANNRLSIPIQNLSDAVRFCIVPLEGGDCKPSAFVKLIIDNEEVLQPIGSAYFEAKNFSLAAPAKTSKTSISVRGTATADSEVKIYDNDVLVGTTFSMSNGEWATKVSLIKPYTHSLHNIHAEVTTNLGKRLLTATKIVDYDQMYADLSSITMAYGKNNFIFDQINGRTNVNNYIYWVHPDATGFQPKPVFTFIANFTNTAIEIISNVNFRVKTLSGSIRNIPGEYDPVSEKWIATSVFSSENAPVNVSADYDLLSREDSYCEEAFNDQISGLLDVINHLKTEFENNVSVTTILDTEDKFEGTLIYGEYNLPISMVKLNYDYVYNRLMNEKQFQIYETEGDNIFYNIESTETCIGYTVVDSNEKLALNITIRDNTESHSVMKAIANWTWIDSMRASFLNGSWVRNIQGFLGTFMDILGLAEYINVRGDFNQMIDNAYRYADAFLKMDERTHSMILARCKNGDYRLGPTQMELADIDRQVLSERTADFSNKYYQYLEDYKTALRWNIAGMAASFGVGKLIGKVSQFVKEGGPIVRWYNRHVNANANAATVGDIVANGLGLAYAKTQDQIDKSIHPAFYDFNGVRDKLWSWANKECIDISNEYIKLNESIKRGYHKCPEDDEEDDNDEDKDDNNDNGKDDFQTPPITPSIDPSGYVYEAVPSNRILGVTATAYYKQQEENMYGDITETAVVWDAAPFGQENPLITDEKGMYAWDVPAGMWQVKFEKDGYEPAQSAWLPVPPPQLDVNIAMTQAKQPEVTTVHAYSDGVTIEFDKFMLPSTMVIGNITVTQNGKLIDGIIEASDIELDLNSNAFCSKIEYKPSELLTEGEITVFVSRSVKSYANIGMSEDFMQSFTVEPRISEIKVAKDIKVNSGSTITVDASILPNAAAQGKTIFIESLNPLIATVSANQIETDENGNISFDLSGLIIGTTAIRLTIKDCDINALVNVTVTTSKSSNQVSTPVASIESGEVEIGTEIYLSCKTENATIYYTIDGSCPCDVNRIKYDGTPILVEHDLTLKVMAEADGMEESDIAEYTYTAVSSAIDCVQFDNNLSIYPLPLGDYLNISNGDYPIESISIFNLNGQRMAHSSKCNKQISMKVGFLSPGIYLLNIRTNGQNIFKKVTKQ